MLEAGAALDAVYRRLGLDLDPSAVMLGQAGDDRVGEASEALAAHGGFTPAELRRLAWSHRSTTDEWLDQLPTHSDHTTLAPERLEALPAAVRASLDARGGALAVDDATWLATAASRGRT